MVVTQSGNFKIRKHYMYFSNLDKKKEIKKVLNQKGICVAKDFLNKKKILKIRNKVKKKLNDSKALKAPRDIKKTNERDNKPELTSSSWYLPNRAGFVKSIHSIFNKYEATIGLEIHAQLLTNTKAYSSDENIYGAKPNSKTCPVSLGHPGTLPVSNTKVIEYAVRMGIAVGAEIRKRNEYRAMMLEE